MDATVAQNGWRIVGASAIGVSHLKSGQPCQDAFAYQLLPGGQLALVVADGAGSALQAATASALSVQTSLQYLSQSLTEQACDDAAGWHELLQATFAAARQALVQQAEQSGESLREFATTLLVAVLSDTWAAAGLVGDCAIAFVDESEQYLSPCLPQKGEFANTTNFLSQPDALERLDIQIRSEPMRGVAALSDGLVELAFRSADHTPHQRFFAPLFSFVQASEDCQAANEQLAAFLASERINARTDDDKTLVLAWRGVGSKE